MKREKPNIDQATRYSLIQTMHNALLSNEQIRSVMGCCNATIYNAISYTGRLKDLPKHGRPKILNQEHYLFIEARTINDRTLSNNRLADELVKAFPELTHCSPQTIMRARHLMGLKYLPRRKNCAITQVSRDNRVAWCRKRIHEQTNWQKVVFSDESWFELGSQKQWIWRHHDDFGPDVVCNHNPHQKKIMIWGAIGEQFKSRLVFIDGVINGDKYFDDIICGSGFLDDADQAFGSTDWIFQQDNARPHVRKDVIEGMLNLDMKLLDWPPYSPDLNIIETVWAIMKRRVELRNPSTVEELRTIVQEVWDELSFDTIHGLIMSIPGRMQQVINIEGYTI